MPHAVDQTEENDDILIAQLLNADPTENRFEGLLSERIDSGPKADDAIDYEDISDNDLADEEEPSRENGAHDDAAGADDDLMEGLFDDAPQAQDADAENDGFDDLFGDAPSSPQPEHDQDMNDGQADIVPAGGAVSGSAPKHLESPPSTQIPKVESPESMRELASFEEIMEEDVMEDEDEDPEIREQRELFAQAQSRLRNGQAVSDLPPAPQTDADVFQAIWHNYEPGAILRFGEILPHRRAYYVPKTPLKPPKAIAPSKVSLELQQDHEKTFKLPPTAAPARNARQAEVDQKGVITVTEADTGEKSDDEDDIRLDDFDENEKIGGVTWQDLQMLCEDWDVRTPDSLSDAGDVQERDNADDMSLIGDWDHDERVRPTKRRRTDGISGSLPIFQDSFPNLEEPETATAKLARKVAINLNDPELLIDIQQPDSTRKKFRTHDFRRDVSGSLTKSLFQKFNISNDESYDILKHNNREKVRNITNLNSLEHSLPAVKLQYPFYKLTLGPRETRSFHRPSFTVSHPGHVIRFDKPKFKKRKQFKGQDPKTVYASSEDLSMADNSNVLLLEYSEEYPTVLSNFGMCNRLINYYRRKDKDDTYRPRLDIGEPVVLTPNDQSPFAIFGEVRQGETVPTLHNGMFRAPVFQHETRPTDFLVVRSHTGTHGTKWYLRNVENLFVVGQQFPSQQVPGIHSRKVTDISKRRLKMLSYRIFTKSLDQKKNPNVKLSNSYIQKHLPGSDIAQNRGKMREFMQYDKESSSWKPMPGETVPDENQMRGWISPEDLCLVDAMQVGVRQLQDAGFAADDANPEDDETNEAQQLAPWNTTRNFLEASSRRAMLELHGVGDPTGRGEGISMIKTSMKGGFKPQGESAKDKMDAKALKELGGHSYNVRKQEQDYNAAIEKIWEAQKASLSSTIEHSDFEDPDDAEAETVEQDTSFSRGRTPQSQYGTPAAFNRRDDETTSQFTSLSTASQSKNKVLRIVRRVPNKYGKIEEQEEIIRDPNVAKAYVKFKKQQEINAMKLEQLKPTGDEEVDARQRKRLMDELSRLERNKERRQVREKQKANMRNGGDGDSKGTTRKCANCNRAGHIKTNKKMCPMLNGIASTVEELEKLEKISPGCTQPPFNKQKIATAQQAQQASATQAPTPQQTFPDLYTPASIDGQGPI
ncbi:putative transcription initiation factor TFIID 111 kDa subunit [Lasiodiplodia hormozganensis]|uniref:Transcription initiation factor TFIID 111 kDa subunit n=2 Tax=Lasiodiplodia TaxID=66739 RepID=A0AA40CSW0_9PEZI|nr:putative transcription initiation factor TFIID subunit [Lasiodiplodia theobromae]KAK0650286.1 putative transcription initiation factor TFIID 111 kDa subunit [Lasiodiplodia hormozganensis]